MSQNLINSFIDILGASHVLTGEAIAPTYKTDWQHTAVREPLVVLRPADTAQLSAAMKLCHLYDRSVTVQGGMTGLVAGGLPDDGQVVISMERMNGIEEIDPASSTMTVWAGTPLQLVQEAATKANLYFAVDLGARGSCQVGGNISTNAGGNRVIRYGMMREQILGLEVVLADGTIVNSLNKMLKNNAGYDLKQLFIGSEGTLGIVTRAVLRLHARTPGYFTAFCALATPDAAVQFLAHLKQTGGALMSYEVMWPDFYDFMTLRVSGIRTPLPTRAAAYALIELATDLSEHDQQRYSDLLESAMEQGWVTDAAIAQSGKEAADFWRLRDAVSEFPVLWSPYRGYDISLPIGDMSRFVASLQAAFAMEFPTSEYAHFGHIGDSNLHVVIHVPGTRAEFPAAAIDACVYEMVRKFGGSISAEHGIGLNKKKYLHYSRNESEMALMKLIKSTLHPKAYMSRGQMRVPQEIPERATQILKGLAQINLPVSEPVDHGMEPLLAVHDPKYLTFLETGHATWVAQGPDWGDEILSNVYVREPNALRGILGQAGRYLADGSCPVGEHTWTSSYWGAQSAISATKAVLAGDQKAYALCRPPGHHTRKDAAGGFCYINNAAISAELLRGQYKRVVILDTDMHHGQGVQEIFYDRDDVYYISVHADTTNFYPATAGFDDEAGAESGKGYNLNLPMPHGSSEEDFFDRVQRALKVLKDFKPDAIVLALGFDVYKDDPQSRVAVTTEGFGRLGREIGALNLPTVVVQEGGYHYDSLAANTVSFFTGFLNP